MPFVSRNLSILAYGQGFTLWHYSEGQTSIDEMSDAGYFVEAGVLLARGDMVLLSAANGGRIMIAMPAQGGVELRPLS